MQVQDSHKTIGKLAAKLSSTNQFVGHIGGDDFVAIVNKSLEKSYFVDLIKKFEYEVLNFYSETDIRNGYIAITNRHGKIEKFPLITITCVLTTNKEKSFINIFELTEYLAEKKHTAKQCKNTI